MSVPQIDYFFSMVSPWAYIGHAAFLDIAAKHRATVSYRPVALLEVFAETGGAPLPKRHPSRQAYRMIELQRWREKRGLNFVLSPKNWPFNASLPDRVVIALAEMDEDPAPFMTAAFDAIWVAERDLTDQATLSDLLAAAGHDADKVLDGAASDEVEAIYAANTAEAIAKGYFGSPVYVLLGEPFWGQDRLDLLDDALHSGRPAFSSKAG